MRKVFLHIGENMKKIAVIFKSVYGTTKRYAEWIAEDLGAELLEHSSVKPEQLKDYDVIVYGGGLYAGGIIGSKLVAGGFDKPLVVFTVGLATPEITDYSPILSKSFSAEKLSNIKVFHLQGGIDYSKLSIVHKMMMAMMKKTTENTPPDKRTSDNRQLLETYGGKVDFTDKAAVAPLVEYVRALYTS
jgi:menaquinone-dependent protoporphyrinogen IX oxidase